MSDPFKPLINVAAEFMKRRDDLVDDWRESDNRFERIRAALKNASEELSIISRKIKRYRQMHPHALAAGTLTLLLIVLGLYVAEWPLNYTGVEGWGFTRTVTLALTTVITGLVAGLVWSIGHNYRARRIDKTEGRLRPWALAWFYTQVGLLGGYLISTLIGRQHYFAENNYFAKKYLGGFVTNSWLLAVVVTVISAAFAALAIYVFSHVSEELTKLLGRRSVLNAEVAAKSDALEDAKRERDDAYSEIEVELREALMHAVTAGDVNLEGTGFEQKSSAFDKLFEKALDLVTRSTGAPSRGERIRATENGHKPEADAEQILSGATT